jgi:FHA domain-containing protein
MKGDILLLAWKNFAMPRGRSFRAVPFAFAATVLVNAAPSQIAMAQTAQRAGEVAARVTASPPSQGVPDSEVTCSAQRSNDGPSLHCTIRFDRPIDVLRTKVADAVNKGLEWTAVYHSFDAGEDETAFYILIDRRTARQAEMRDLSDVFARAKGRQQIAVSVFANDLTKLQPFTIDRGAVSKAFDRISPGGSASELLHHATEAIQQLDKITAPRKVLLIASSGRSDDPAFKLDDVVQLARNARVRIVTLGYVDQAVDTPAHQILERMSDLTGGFYYRSDLRRPLPPEIRSKILSQYSSGGTLDATASKQLSSSAEVTLQHPNNLASSFSVKLEEAQANAEPKDKSDIPGVPELWNRLRSSPWMLAAVGVLVLLIIAAAITLFRQSRNRGKLEPASADGVRNVLRAQREAGGPAAPGVQPEVPVSELVKKAEPPSPAAEPLQPKEPAAKPMAAAEVAAIAWIEFNSVPGRVAIRKKHVTIGREGDNDVVTDPNEDTVSRHHAAISVNNNGRFQISNRTREYRHTPNPIFVNDKEMEHAELADGDRVKLGTGSYGFVFVEVR